MMLSSIGLESQITELKARMHNAPEEEFREEVMKITSDYFDKMTAPCLEYRNGADLLYDNPKLYKEPSYFNCMSLANWLTITDSLNINYISVRILGVVRTLLPIEMIGDSFDREGDEFKEFEEIFQSLEEGEILRWNHCSGMDIKFSTSMGEEISPGWEIVDGKKLPISLDKRLLLGLLDYMEEEIPLWARPIVKLRKIPGEYEGLKGEWSREWRVFIQNNRVIAISNYYLQTPASEEDLPTIYKVKEIAEYMVATMVNLKIYPHHPRYGEHLDINTVNCTLDFAEQEDGDLIFIEGGPAHIWNPAWGAHPCCFIPGEPLEGIALELGKPPIPFSQSAEG